MSLRRWLLQLHLWTGLIAGLYFTFMFLTGALLLFRLDLQRQAFPALFPPATATAPAAPAEVLQGLQARYPAARIAGLDAPTTMRSSYLAYLTEAGQLRTVLLDPASGAVLGELPPQTWIATLQALHFNLLAGRTGRALNGVGAWALLLMVASGSYLWLRGRHLAAGGARALHATLAAWLALPCLMWALSGLHFAYPQGFRRVVGAVATLHASERPPPVPRAAAPLPQDWTAVLDAAARSQPGQAIARIVLPGSEQAPAEVLFSARQPTPAGDMRLRRVFVDPRTAAVLEGPVVHRGAGDEIVRWAGPLHMASFGVPWARYLWLALALGMPVLWWTSWRMWWTRVARPCLQAGSSRGSRKLA